MFLFSSNPRKASSAGFTLDGTYLHWLTLLSLCICCIRLATNALNFLILLFMLPNTTLLSVQKVSFFHSMSNYFLIRAVMFRDKTVATNSIRGMVTYFFGVTLDFPIKIQQWIFPDTLTSRKYVGCPSPSSDDLKNNGVIILWLCKSPLPWCIFLWKFSPSPSNCSSCSSFLANVVRNHFIPNMHDLKQT